MTDDTKGMIYGFIGVTVFGLTLPVTKAVIPYFDPLFIGLGRALVAGLLAMTLLLILRKKIPDQQYIPSLMIVALGVVVGFPVLVSWAMVYLPASHGGVVLGILPVMTALLGVLMGNEKPSRSFWVVSITGGILVVFYSLLQTTGGLHVADLLLLGAVVAAATGYAVGARLAGVIGGWQVISWAHVLAFPFILIPAIYTAPPALAAIPVQTYAQFLYLAAFSQFLGFFFWYKGLALGGIARVSQTQLLQPVITLLASVVFLGELIDITTMVFIVLVIFSVWLGKKMPIGDKLDSTVLPKTSTSTN